MSWRVSGIFVATTEGRDLGAGAEITKTEAGTMHLLLILAFNRDLFYGCPGGFFIENAGRKLGGRNVPTQLVSGAFGLARNDAITRRAHPDTEAAKCPIPGMTTSSVRAAIFPQLGGVTASKPPDRIRVGMVLRVTARCASASRTACTGTLSVATEPS